MPCQVDPRRCLLLLTAALSLAGCVTGRGVSLADRGDGGSAAGPEAAPTAAGEAPGGIATGAPTPVLAMSGNVILPVYDIRPPGLSVSTSLPSLLPSLPVLDGVSAQAGVTVGAAGPGSLNAGASVQVAPQAGVGLSAAVTPGPLGGASTGPSPLQGSVGVTTPAAGLNLGATVNAPSVAGPVIGVDLAGAVPTASPLAAPLNGVIGAGSAVVGVQVVIDPGD